MNDKLIQIGGKSYKECEVVMLPVAKSKLVLVEPREILYLNQNEKERNEFSKPQHIYILSSEEIKEGNQYLIYNGQICKTFTYGERRDICFKIDNDIVYCQNNKWRKIIATTNSELKI